jgi:hypothetical protein
LGWGRHPCHRHCRLLLVLLLLLLLLWLVFSAQAWKAPAVVVAALRACVQPW